MMKINLNNVPNKPGVYIWKNKFNEIIYVGKAKRLKQRMSQYFKGMLNSYKTSAMVEEIFDFEYIITSSDKEALILERNYIEKHFPKYNILMTDDKRYPYIKLQLKDKLEISLAYRVRSRSKQKAEYFGPYPTGYGARKLANLVQSLTTFEIGMPIKTNDPEVWKEKYQEAKSILSSGSSKLIRDLKKRMNDASEKQQYEIAHDLKESIESLVQNKEKQAVEFLENINFDVIGFIEKDGYLSITMLFYRNGLLLSKKEFIHEIIVDIKTTTNEFVDQYYSINKIPENIISNFELDFENSKIPLKGSKKKVLQIALENSEDNISLKLKEYIRKEERTIGSMNKLKNILGIKNISHIIMMDNSNTNNTLPVSVVVSYRNGIKQKKEYRKYNLEKTNRDADVEYMRQGVNKYFSKEINPIPDLFIVDGGIAQVNEVKQLIPNINVIGLVKNNKHITDAIIDRSGKRIEIEDKLLLNFLREMQYEVDRFAKYHHTTRRVVKTLEGELGRIPGIGPSIERKLLDHFKSYSTIYNASEDDLSNVVSKKIAKAIFDNFNNK